MVVSEPQEIDANAPQIVNLSQVNVETIHADLVRANQTSIRQLESEEVDLQTSAAGTIKTGELRAQDSALGVVISNQATVVDSIVTGLKAETIDFKGAAGFVVANTVAAEEIKTLAVIANNTHAGSINTGILLSREVHGNVTTTLDGQTALMVGMVGGAVAGLILLTGKLLFGRKN